MVSEKEREYLVELKAKKIKEQYSRQQLEELNGRVRNNPDIRQPSITSEYLDFRKEESARNEAKKEELTKHFLGTKPPDSPDDFKAWYYAGTAEEEFQVSCGIIPPRSLTPAGAVWHSEVVAYSWRQEAERMIKAEKERLKETGFSPNEIENRESAIRKKAFNKVGEEWKKERAEALKVWSESKAAKSFQSFTATKEASQQNQNEPVEVKVADLKQWRQEAQAIGRSEKHLDKIEQVLNSAKDKANNPAATIEIGERDFKAMQRDRLEFKKQEPQLREENQHQSQTETLARGMRR